MRCKLKHFFSMLFTNGHITPIIGMSRRNWLDELNPPVSTSANHHLHFNLPLLAVNFTAISRSANRYQPLILPLLAVRRTAISNSLTHQGFNSDFKTSPYSTTSVGLKLAMYCCICRAATFTLYRLVGLVQPVVPGICVCLPRPYIMSMVVHSLGRGG